jgi:anti-sigma regulatory factor (Ser/Thr protein kinase)
MRHARRFHRKPDSVAGARHFVRDLLSEQPRETVEAAELMVSELATNSVRHARSDFELVVQLSRCEIRVEVSDHGEGQPVLRSPTVREQSGRGLQIVQVLAEDWGVTPSPDGKLVWFTLPLSTPAGEHGPGANASSEKAPEQSHRADGSPPRGGRSSKAARPPRSIKRAFASTGRWMRCSYVPRTNGLVASASWRLLAAQVVAAISAAMPIPTATQSPATSR